MQEEEGITETAEKERGSETGRERGTGIATGEIGIEKGRGIDEMIAVTGEIEGKLPPTSFSLHPIFY